MQAAVNEFDDVTFIEPVRWINCKAYPGGATQSHFHASDMKTAYTLAEQVDAWTSHGITAANDPTFYKGKTGLMVPGWLKSGGSTTPLPKRPPKADKAARAEYDKYYHRHARHPDTITGSSLAILDVDGMTPEFFARITGKDGRPAAMAGACGLVYETASHTPEASRARVIGILAEAYSVEGKAAACLRFAKWLMRAAGAVQVAPGRWEFDGQPVKLDKSVYLANQGIYFPDADRSKMHVFSGPQLDVADMPEISPDELATASHNAGATTKTTYAADNLTSLSLELAEWAAVEGEETARPGEFCFPDHPFHSGSAKPDSLVLRIDETPEKSCFIGLTDTWLTLKAECKAQGKSVMYATAIGLNMPEELAAKVWGGEQLIKKVADADDFPDLEPQEPAETLAGLEDYDPAADPFADLAAVDIFSPPGLLGEIYRDVERLAHRSLPMASIAAAIQLAAVVGGLSGKRSVNGGKLSPLTIVLALSAAGKEQGQSYVKDMLDSLTLNDESCVRFALAKPRSDKEVMRNVLRNAVDVWENDPAQAERAKPKRYGSTLVIGDEADQLFSAIGNRNAATSTAGIGSVLLEVITAKRFSYSGLHREEELHAIQTKRDALENKMEEAAASLAVWESGEKPKRKVMLKHKAERIVKGGEKTLRRLALRETLVIKGVRNPVFAAMLSAVPATFTRFISDNAADSGLLSRALILLAGEEVGRLRDNVPEFDTEAPETAVILRKLGAMLNGVDLDDLSQHGQPEYQFTEEAQAYRERLKDIFEAEEYREHPTLGAIYRRAMLRVDELATLTALDTGVIDIAAYHWAATIFNVSTASMRGMIAANSAPTVGAGLKLAIVNYLRDPRRHGSASKSKICEGTTRGKVMRQARQAANLAGQADPFDIAFDSLLKAGVVKVELKQRGELVTLLKKL